MPTKEKQPKRRLKLVIPDVRGESIDDLDEIKLACAENLLTTVLAWRMLAEETPTVASLRKKIERLEKLRGDLNARRLRVIHGLETSGKIVREEFANLRQSLPSPAPETVDDLGVSPHSDHLHALIQVKDPRGPRAYERLKRLRSHYAVLQTGDRQRDGLADAVSKIEASLEELNAALERQQALRSGINRLLEVIGKPQERIEDLELNSMLPAVTILQRELDRTAGSSRPISPEPMTERNIASIVDRLSEEATFRATVISRFIDPVMVTFGIDPRAVNVSADNWSARLKELRRQLGVPVPDEADSGPLTTTERKQLQMLTRFGNVPTNQLCPLLRRMAERREVMAVFTTTDAQLVRDAVWEICHSKGEAHIDRAMTYAEHRFRWVDRDRNGFLGSSDLRWAIAEESGGENKRILKRWLDKVGAIEELSNDEYGDENDGLHSGDLAKYKGWEDPLALGYGASTDDLLRMARESDCKTERRDAIFKLFQSIREKSNGSSQACVRPNAVFQLAATSAGDKAPSNELRPGMLAQAEDKATLTLERFVERAGGKLPVMTFTDERDAAKKLRAMFHADDFVDTGTDEVGVIKLLEGMEEEEQRRLNLRIAYQGLFGQTLIESITSEFSFSERGKVLYLLLRPSLRTRAFKIGRESQAIEYLKQTSLNEIETIFQVPDYYGNEALAAARQRITNAALAIGRKRTLTRAKTIHTRFRSAKVAPMQFRHFSEWLQLHRVNRAVNRRDSVYRHETNEFFRRSFDCEEAVYEAQSSLETTWARVESLEGKFDERLARFDSLLAKCRAVDSSVADKTDLQGELEALGEELAAMRKALFQIEQVWAKELHGLRTATDALVQEVARGEDVICQETKERGAHLDDFIEAIEVTKAVTKTTAVIAISTAATFATFGVLAGTKASLVVCTCAAFIGGTVAGSTIGIALEVIDATSGRGESLGELWELYWADEDNVKSWPKWKQKRAVSFRRAIHGHVATAATSSLGTVLGLQAGHLANNIGVLAKGNRFWAFVKDSPVAMNLIFGGSVSGVTDTVGRALSGQDFRWDRVGFSIAQGMLFRSVGVRLKDHGTVVNLAADAGGGIILEGGWSAYSRESFNVTAALLNSFVAGYVSVRGGGFVQMKLAKPAPKGLPPSAGRQAFELSLRTDGVESISGSLKSGNYMGESVVIRVGDAADPKMMPKGSKMRYGPHDVTVTPEIKKQFALGGEYSEGSTVRILMHSEGHANLSSVLRLAQRIGKQAVANWAAKLPKPRVSDNGPLDIVYPPDVDGVSLKSWRERKEVGNGSPITLADIRAAAKGDEGSVVAVPRNGIDLPKQKRGEVDCTLHGLHALLRAEGIEIPLHGYVGKNASPSLKQIVRQALGKEFYNQLWGPSAKGLKNSDIAPILNEVVRCLGESTKGFKGIKTVPPEDVFVAVLSEQRPALVIVDFGQGQARARHAVTLHGIVKKDGVVHVIFVDPLIGKLTTLPQAEFLSLRPKGAIMLSRRGTPGLSDLFQAIRRRVQGGEDSTVPSARGISDEPSANPWTQWRRRTAGESYENQLSFGQHRLASETASKQCDLYKGKVVRLQDKLGEAPADGQKDTRRTVLEEMFDYTWAEEHGSIGEFLTAYQHLSGVKLMRNKIDKPAVFEAIKKVLSMDQPPSLSHQSKGAEITPKDYYTEACRRSVAKMLGRSAIAEWSGTAKEQGAAVCIAAVVDLRKGLVYLAHSGNLGLKTPKYHPSTLEGLNALREVSVSKGTAPLDGFEYTPIDSCADIKAVDIARHNGSQNEDLYIAAAGNIDKSGMEPKAVCCNCQVTTYGVTSVSGRKELKAFFDGNGNIDGFIRYAAEHSDSHKRTVKKGVIQAVVTQYALNAPTAYESYTPSSKKE